MTVVKRMDKLQHDACRILEYKLIKHRRMV